MKMKALINLKEEKVCKVKQSGIHTLELVTPDNVSMAEEIEEGEDIFITSEGKRDIKQGSEGIIAEVHSIKKFYTRIGTLFDERETLVARVQLEYIEDAKVEDVVIKDRGAEVEIEEHFWMG